MQTTDLHVVRRDDEDVLTHECARDVHTGLVLHANECNGGKCLPTSRQRRVIQLGTPTGPEAIDFRAVTLEAQLVIAIGLD